MSKASKIDYDPKLSIHENAVKNGVSDAGIYYHLRTHNVDRAKQNAKEIVKDIKKTLKENKDASQATVAKITGHSVTTINKYWKAATEDAPLVTESKAKTRKVFEWGDNIPEPSQQRNTLMSKRLERLSEILQTADLADIQSIHDFLFEHPERPMLFIGNGGMEDHLAPMLYEMNCGVAKCITPLELASMSDATLKNSRAIVMSEGGKNMDVKYAVKRLLAVNPENTAGFTNYMHEGSVFKEFDGTPAKLFVCKPRINFEESFIAIESKFYRYAVLYNAFTESSASKLQINPSPSANYRYSLNKSNGRITPLSKIQHFVVLYSGYGEPAAHDFEGAAVESGQVSVQLSDYRNFCHGRFLFVGNHTKHTTKEHYLADSDVAVIALVSPREKKLAEGILEKAIPSKTPVVYIESEHETALAALDLLVKINFFFADFSEKGCSNNPCDPYNYNASEVDKRIPKNSIAFKEEIKKFGQLRYPPKEKAKQSNGIGPQSSSVVEGLKNFFRNALNGNRNVTILDGIEYNPREYQEYPFDGTVPFNSEAVPENRMLGNHYNCILTFRGVEFYGFEQMYSALKFREHPEVLDDIMNANSARQAKQRSHKYSFKGKGPVLYDSDYGSKSHRNFALCQLFKYLSVKEYRDRLRELRDFNLVEIKAGTDPNRAHAECIYDPSDRTYKGCNFSGRTTMIVRDMMLKLEDDALNKAAATNGRELSEDEREAVIKTVLDEVRAKFESLPRVKQDTDAIIDYIKSSSKISLTRPPLQEIDSSLKGIIIGFDGCLFDTSVANGVADKSGLIPQYKLYDGWKEVFDWAAANNVKIGILSDTAGSHIKATLEHFGLHCDAIIGKQFRKKKKPNPYLSSLMMDQLLMGSDQLTYFGNRSEDAEQARISKIDFYGTLWSSNVPSDIQRGKTILNPKGIIEVISI